MSDRLDALRYRWVSNPFWLAVFRVDEWCHDHLPEQRARRLCRYRYCQRRDG